MPLVVRLEGTNVERGKEILSNSDVHVITADDLDDAATKAVKRHQAMTLMAACRQFARQCIFFLFMMGRQLGARSHGAKLFSTDSARLPERSSVKLWC